MICPECGTENSALAGRCQRCGEPLQRGMERWMLAAAGVLGIGALVVLAFRMGAFPSHKQEPAATPPPAQARPQPPESPPKDLSFSLDLPGSHWSFEDVGAASSALGGVPAALSMVRRQGLAYGVVISEASPLSPEGLATLALERLKNRSEGFSLRTRQAARLDGTGAEQADFSLHSGGLDIHYLATYTVQDGVGYQILFWCLDRDFPIFRDEFQQTLESWRWKPVPKP